MKRDGTYARLALARHLLETATARFAALTEGVDHPRVREARNRLENATRLTIAAAGALSDRARTGLSLVLMWTATWAVAALAGQVLGLSGGWTIAVTVAVAPIGLALPITKLLNAYARRLDRRRTRRPESVPPVVAPPGIGPEAEVLALLRLARRELAAVLLQRAAAQRYGRVARSAAGFDWLLTRDRWLRSAGHADRSLCVAIRAIEIWLPLRVDER